MLKPEHSLRVRAPFAGSDNGSSLGLQELGRNLGGDGDVKMAVQKSLTIDFMDDLPSSIIAFQRIHSTAPLRATPTVSIKTFGQWKETSCEAEKTHICVHTHPCTVFLGPFHPCHMDPIQHQARI